MLIVEKLSYLFIFDPHNIKLRLQIENFESIHFLVEFLLIN